MSAPPRPTRRPRGTATARALAYDHHLRQRGDMLEHQRVVDELDNLPAADRTAMGHITAHVAQERFDFREQRRA